MVPNALNTWPKITSIRLQGWKGVQVRDTRKKKELYWECLVTAGRSQMFTAMWSTDIQQIVTVGLEMADMTFG